MLSVASLLNPVKPEERSTGTRLPSNPSISLRTSPSFQDSPQPSTPATTTKKSKMNKDGAVFAKGKVKGEVNFPPFEHLDEETVREVQKFQVYPLGKIQEYSRHIPYNSEKKTFLEKTGRESFEVFQYIYKVPGDDKDYTVMWDYNNGLVRITPFFKCCKYSKTTPAKMLNLNPGLKEITHSITGGALAAQGYWMPYSCALQVCATFCAHIAPALIPIFGPDFPSLCVPLEAPEYSRMIIPNATVRTATAEAEAFRLQYSTATSPSSDTTNYTHSPMRTTPPTLSRRLRLKRTFDYDTDNASEASSGDGCFHSPVTPGREIDIGSGGWRPHAQTNHQKDNMSAHSANSSIDISSSAGTNGGGNGSKQNAPNPILSAIPRSVDISMSETGLRHHHSTQPSWHSINVNTASCNDKSHGSKKRGANFFTQGNGYGDEDYDAEESSTSVVSDTRSDGDKEMEDISLSSTSYAPQAHPFQQDLNHDNTSSGAEKNAAWLLMKLSVKDGESIGAGCVDETMMDGERDAEGEIDEEMLGTSSNAGSAYQSSQNAQVPQQQQQVVEGPRVKRRRATSM